jgi:6-phosphogluconolactonase
VSEAVPRPGLTGEQLVLDTAAATAGRLAERLVGELRHALARFACAHLALSGGSSGRLLCAALAERDLIGPSEWARIHLWQVDERCVPDGDARRNLEGLRSELVARVPLPAQSLHAMPVLQAEGAERYERDLRLALAARPDEVSRRLDAVVLGMGPDGHTASLFPGTAALDERERWVVLNDGESVAPPRPRMTMTYPVLNRAAFIALLVTGAGKREALTRAAQHREDFRALPVVGIVPSTGSRMAWYCDRAALPD